MFSKFGVGAATETSAAAYCVTSTPIELELIVTVPVGTIYSLGIGDTLTTPVVYFPLVTAV